MVRQTAVAGICSDVYIRTFETLPTLEARRTTCQVRAESDLVTHRAYLHAISPTSIHAAPSDTDERRDDGGIRRRADLGLD